MKLKIKNMGALTGTKEIDLTAGISALVGPNGCGKSTIVGSLFFVITGESITRCNLDELVSWGEDSASVELTSSDFSIVRSITRGKGCKGSFTRGSTTLTRREEIDEAIMSMFNIGDKTAFRQVYFAEQFKAIEILEGTNSKRLEALSALLGFGKFEKFRDNLKAIGNTVFRSRVDEDFLRVLTEQKASATARCVDLTAELKTVSQAIRADSDVEQLKLLSDSTPIEDLNAVQTALAAKRREFDQVEDSLSNLVVVPPTPEESAAYSGALEYKRLSQDLTQATEAVKAVGESSTPSSQQIQHIRDKAIDQKMSLRAEREQQNKRLGILNGGKCPITGGDPCSDLNKIVNPASIAATVEDLDKKIKDIDADIAELESLLAAAQDYEARLQAATRDLSRAQDRIKVVEQYADFDTEAYVDKLESYRTSSADRQPLEQAKTELLKSIAKLEADEYNLSQYNLAEREKILEAKTLLTAHEQAVSEARDKEARLQEAIKTRDNSSEALERAEMQNEKAAKGEAAVEFLESVRWALHKDNLPRLLVATARGELNKRLAEYLELFDFPYVVQWTPAGGIDYMNAFGEMLPASSLSGGQKYLLAVANRCAAADLLGSTFPLMVLDEPTTGLDDDNRSKMAVMLQKVAQTLNGKGVSLIVPTHDDELLGSANLIRVKEL